MVVPGHMPRMRLTAASSSLKVGGVSPDVDVENDPYLEYMGDDEQLNRAIQIILEKLKTGKKEIPAIPAFPDKSGKKK